MDTEDKKLFDSGVATIANLRDFLMEYIGEECPEFDSDCHVCKGWCKFHELVNFLDLEDFRAFSERQ